MCLLLRSPDHSEAGVAELTRREIESPISRAAVPRRIEPVSTPIYSIRSCLRTLRIRYRTFLVVFPRKPVVHPLRHVARHVIQTPRIGRLIPWDESAARILSANIVVPSAGVPNASADPYLGFRLDWQDSREGPWAVIHSQCRPPVVYAIEDTALIIFFAAPRGLDRPRCERPVSRRPAAQHALQEQDGHSWKAQARRGCSSWNQ